MFENLKLKMSGRPVVRYLDVIMSPADPSRSAAILTRAGCDAGTFVLVVPGGGTGHPGAEAAAGHFMRAARALAARGTPIVYVGPAESATDEGAQSRAGAVDAAERRNWHHVGPLPQAELAELMRSARLIVANGGSTLLQAIACGSACIAVPIAKDQSERTRRCVAAGVAVAAALDEQSIIGAADRLLQDEPQRAALADRAARLGLADGIDVALRALGNLFESARSASPP